MGDQVASEIKKMKAEAYKKIQESNYDKEADAVAAGAATVWEWIAWIVHMIFHWWAHFELKDLEWGSQALNLKTCAADSIGYQPF